MMTYLLAAIASVSLLVGGIGIMNMRLGSGRVGRARRIKPPRVGGRTERAHVWYCRCSTSPGLRR